MKTHNCRRCGRRFAKGNQKTIVKHKCPHRKLCYAEWESVGGWQMRQVSCHACRTETHLYYIKMCGAYFTDRKLRNTSLDVTRALAFAREEAMSLAAIGRLQRYEFRYTIRVVRRKYGKRIPYAF